mgnify:CR=1 FL=1
MPTIYQSATQKVLETSRQLPPAPDWLQSKREAARAHFERLGFPSTRDEEYKYTDVSPALEIEAKPLPSAYLNGKTALIAQQLPFAQLEAHRVVFVDGHFSPALSQIGELPEGVVLSNLATKIESGCEILPEHFGRLLPVETDPFAALNTIFAQDGLYLRVPANVQIETPIHAVFVSTDGATTYPRNLVMLGNFAKASLFKSFISFDGARHFAVAATEIELGEGAVLHHAKVGLESENAYHVGLTQIQVARGARVVSHNATFGGALVRNNSNAVFGGEGAEATLNGIVLAGGTQLIDNHTVMDHAVPHCESHEHYAHILDDRATGVFNGKIFVRPDAQKTDAKQSNRTILLSPDATINAKPQLEIFADDVKCTHGATIGQLDQNALFYLRARGVEAKTAHAILIRAFAAEILESLENEGLREALEGEIEARLG